MGKNKWVIRYFAYNFYILVRLMAQNQLSESSASIWTNDDLLCVIPTADFQIIGSKQKWYNHASNLVSKKTRSARGTITERDYITNYHMTHITDHISHTTYYISHIITSHITYHITHHIPQITYHIKYHISQIITYRLSSHHISHHISHITSHITNYHTLPRMTEKRG